MKTTFTTPAMPKTGTLVLIMAAGGNLSEMAAAADEAMSGGLSRAIKAAGFEGKSGSLMEVLAPSGTELERILVAGLGKPEDLAEYDAEKLGGTIAGKLLGRSKAKVSVAVEPVENAELSTADLAALIASGFKLRDYVFDRYQTRKSDNGKDRKPASVSVLCSEKAKAKKRFDALSAIADGVHLARDLVNEPPNILFPAEFAQRAKALTKLGVKVDILTEKDLEKQKMHALLGVGQGSVRESRVAVMRWDGGKKDEKPVAFVGKGVTFDTGGISLKPGAGMGDMKGDMGGAACVTGLMHALAARKAKVNAVGVIGLVENMPDAAAQRPGDIVTSMSGQTIEILNTDAEGRLVLADALWYTQKRFSPKFMVDLATLTGAILVALGQDHAGLFSNDDELAGRLHEAGQQTGEKVWRLPLAREYDKLIDTPNADMKNIGGRNAGSITAAQFLQRFVNDVPWAHLDIAGTAMSSPKTPISQGWASGYGVRLLNRLVELHYES